MSFSISFMMDVAILILLAATVYFAFRLSLSLRNFKESRFEMEGLVNRLTANIDHAEKAIGGMQNSARKVGLELDEIIGDAKKLADELRIMNESGNSLAGRLEALADRNRAMVEQLESKNLPAMSGMAEPIRYNRELPRALQAPVEDTVPRGFVIHDRDYDHDPDELLDDEFGEAPDDGFQSQAERDLYEALQNSSARQRGRVS